MRGREIYLRGSVRWALANVPRTVAKGDIMGEMSLLTEKCKDLMIF